MQEMLLQAKCSKTKEIPKTWVSTGKQFEDLRQKKYNFSFDQTAPGTTPLVYATIEDGACSQEKLNWRKTEKNFSDWNCWSFARLELRSQVSNVIRLGTAQQCNMTMYTSAIFLD